MNQLVERQDGGMTVHQMAEQVNQIQALMRTVMKDEVHFGLIPGTGKKALLKPGAEKIGLMFGCRTKYEIRRDDLPNGHREYEVLCHITDRQGNHIGSGVGACTTMEKKYRYRAENTNKPVPRDYWEDRDQSVLGGPSFVPRKKDGRWFIFQQTEYDNPADYYNCVTPETKLLTHDLRWVKAGDIQTGDLLIGVDEEMSDQYARNFAIGEAEVFGRRLDTVYEVEVEDGRTVQCNGEHQWLVRKVGKKGTEWVSTEEIFEALSNPKGRPRHWSIMSVCQPWEFNSSHEAGYLSGLLDADGSLGLKQLFVMFAQQDNVVLHRFEAGIERMGFDISKRSSVRTADQVESCVSQEPVYQVRILGGFQEQLRAIGTLRPPRILDRWTRLFDITQRRLEGRGSGAGRPVRIKAIRKVGEKEIVLLGTSCKTYIAEGLVCHNTVLKMAKKRAYVDAILTCTAASDFFDQEEVIDTPELYPDMKAEQQQPTGNQRQQYPDEQFKKNLPNWRELIDSGKATPDQIITTVGSKYVLSAEQRSRIQNLTSTEETHASS